MGREQPGTAKAPERKSILGAQIRHWLGSWHRIDEHMHSAAGIILCAIAPWHMEINWQRAVVRLFD
jgi:hypothetical protein